MILTPTQLEIMVKDTSAQAVYELLMDQGFIEEAQFVETKYFEL